MSKKNEDIKSAKRSKCPYCLATILGVTSIGLYYLLYIYSGEVRHLAELTNQGDRQMFYLPVVIALLFSFVHGAFTGHFWELLGLKAKRAK